MAPAVSGSCVRVLALVVLLFLPEQAWGTPAVRVGYYEFGVFYNRGSGIDRDMAEELARRTGTVLAPLVTTRARIWHDLESGDLDLALSAIETPERDRFCWFIPYMTMKNYLLIRNPEGSRIRGPQDFLKDSTLVMGAVASFHYGTTQDLWLDQLRASGRVEESSSIDLLFRKLKEGRVTAVFSQPPVYSYYLEAMGMVGSVTVADWTPQERGVVHGIVLSRATVSAQEADRWRSAVESVRKDGTLNRILRKYLSEAEAAAMVDL